MSIDSEQWQYPQCNHDRETQVRLREVQGAVPRWVVQCLDCGSQVRAVKSEYVGFETKKLKPLFDEDLPKLWRLRCNRLYEEYSSRKKDEKSREWRGRYNAHLESQLWKAKREKVLERCGGMCEGCRECRADQVHHLTYDHMGDELLWELVAVCMDCHRKIHPHMEEEEEDVFSTSEASI